MSNIKYYDDNSIVSNSGVMFNAGSELELWRAETLLEKEPETIAWLDHQAAEGGVFYDVGANIGAYSLYAALANAELMVYSFEPVENNYIALLDNRRLNEKNPEFKNNVNPFNIALSDCNGISRIYIKDDRVGNSGAQLNSPQDEYGDAFSPVKVDTILSVSIDCLVREFSFPSPNFVKIDVDGLEGKIISGMTDTLKEESLRSVLVEINSADQDDDFFGLFGSFGFKLDDRFNNYPNHSSLRRSKKGSLAKNVVFTRE